MYGPSILGLLLLSVGICFCFFLLFVVICCYFYKDKLYCQWVSTYSDSVSLKSVFSVLHRPLKSVWPSILGLLLLSVVFCCYLLFFLLFVVILTMINRIVGWVLIRIQFRLRVRLAWYTVL